MTVASLGELKTLTEIAKDAGVPVHKARYAVESRGIQETCRLRHFRLFDETKAAEIRSALRRIGTGF
jgi:hypothetical protein